MDINTTRFDINYKLEVNHVFSFDCCLVFHKCMHQCDMATYAHWRMLLYAEQIHYSNLSRSLSKTQEKKLQQHQQQQQRTSLQQQYNKMVDWSGDGEWNKVTNKKRSKKWTQKKNRTKDKFYCDSCDICSTFLTSSSSVVDFSHSFSLALARI